MPKSESPKCLLVNNYKSLRAIKYIKNSCLLTCEFTVIIDNVEFSANFLQKEFFILYASKIGEVSFLNMIAWSDFRIVLHGLLATASQVY